MKKTVAVTIRVPSENMEYTALCRSMLSAVELVEKIAKRASYESALELIAISFMLKHDKIYSVVGHHIITIELSEI